MNTTIALSINAICSEIYCRTAIRHSVDTARPPMLTQPMQPALERLICSSFTSLCLELGASPAARDGDIISTTLPLAAGVCTEAICAALVRIIALRILAEAYFSADRRFATQMSGFADTSIAAVSTFIRPSAIPRLTRHPL